jgi:hypothetical protein
MTPILGREEFKAFLSFWRYSADRVKSITIINFALNHLQADSSMRTLNINRCNISEEGGIHVSRSLVRLSCLESLYVSGCGIGPKAGKVYLSLSLFCALNDVDYIGYHQCISCKYDVKNFGFVF